MVFGSAVLTSHSADHRLQPSVENGLVWLNCASSAGGGVQPVVRAPRASVQEAARHSLPGLRPERQRHPGRFCGARTAQDGRPDAGLRPVLFSKSQRSDGCRTVRLNSNWKLRIAFEWPHSAFRLALHHASTAPFYTNSQSQFASAAWFNNKNQISAQLQMVTIIDWHF